MRPATPPGSLPMAGRLRASYEVKAGDVLEIRFGERTVKLEVLMVADNVGKSDASAMYREIL